MTDSFRTRDLSPARAPFVGIALLGSALLTSACVDDDDPTSQVRTPTVARFAPSAGEIPIPNDLLFSGSLDGTLNFDPATSSDPLIALSTVDGWSTVAPIFVRFTREIDPATVIGGTTVRVFEVTAFTDVTAPVGGPVLSADNELVEGVDYAVSLSSDFGNTAIQIQPLIPFTASTLDDGDPNTTDDGNKVYMVTITNGVTDTAGFAVARDAEYRFAAEPMLNDPPSGLAQLNALINSQLNAYAATTSMPREDVVVSFTFTTQSVGSTLATLFGIANGQESAIVSGLCAQLGTCGMDPPGVDPNSSAQIRTITTADSLGSASELLGGPVGVADVYGGIFQAPYYLTAAANSGSFAGLTNDPSPLISEWQARFAPTTGVTERNLTRFNPLPISTSSQQVPVLISVPNPSIMMPPDGYPVIIFQHGITGNRSAMLFVAEALASAGFACVAIDLPLHGVAADERTPSGVSLFAGYNNDPMASDLWERTFGLDLLDNATGAPGPDGEADSSGAHFINLADLAVSRDNLRQSVADLFNLKVALGGLTISGNDVIDESQVHFIGHSLGGIVGTGFLANQPDIAAATLAMPGSSIPYLLNGSASFGPVVQGGLAQSGVLSGTPDFANFLLTAQTVLDSADPINYAALVQTPIYLPEVIGDLVVPNEVSGAPFAGTDPMISALGLTITNMSTPPGPDGIQVAVRFTEGNHSTILLPKVPNPDDPMDPPPTPEEIAAFVEMQSQTASFHQSGGTSLTITNDDVIEQ